MSADSSRSTGSIPACAGEPPPRRPRHRRRWVYPRVCGGTRVFCGGLPAVYGLSPRVRGNRGADAVAFGDERSIPACAGEPRPRRLQWRPCRVYPRVCGGTLWSGRVALSGTGLSPRVRGNPAGIAPVLANVGSIPACAGEPGRRRLWRRERRVYPRVCGGTGRLCRRRGRWWGLSPRVRGNPREAGVNGGARGSIPACAGEPCRPNSRGCTGRVYPRVCGGTRRPALSNPPNMGLSPRVRGNLAGLVFRQGIQRSIPACAGEPRTP